MIKSTVIFIVIVSISLYYSLRLNLPEECDYSVSLRALCTAVEVFKIASAINFVFGGSYSTPFRIPDTMFEPKNSSQVTVTFSDFAGVKVALFRPSFASGTRGKSGDSAIIFFHGRGFMFGSINTHALLAEAIARRTGLLVISPEYRLAPEHPFPAAFDDCLAVTKDFLKKAKSYGVNPRKVVLMGDSAGGNLAAAVAMALGQEKSPNPICMVNLIYPTLQFVNFQLPSYRQNPDRPMLDAVLMMQFALNYIGVANDTELAPLLWRNAHMQNFDRPYVLQRVNEQWVPKRYKVKPDRPYVEMVPEEAYETLQAKLKDIQDVVTDIRLSTLIAEDSILKKLPRTHITTCEYDMLRDDGVILHQRMQRLGLESSFINWDFCVHGILASYGQITHELLDAATEDMIKIVEATLKTC